MHFALNDRLSQERKAATTGIKEYELEERKSSNRLEKTEKQTSNTLEAIKMKE